MSVGRVFIVDDEEHVRKTVGLALKQGGYEVIEAADGEEATSVCVDDVTSQREKPLKGDKFEIGLALSVTC